VCRGVYVGLLLFVLFFYGIFRDQTPVKIGPFKNVNVCNTVRLEIIAAYDVAGVLFTATSCFD